MIDAQSLPEWIRPLQVLTVDDMVRGGACRDGVRDWMENCGCKETAIDPRVAKYSRDKEAGSYVSDAAHLSGSGDGYGDGDGNGYGDGTGSGNGAGAVTVTGAVAGSVAGNGNGNGNGDGNGSGYGEGNGAGAGDG